MARIELEVDGKDIEAAQMLKIALSLLRVLKAIERQFCEEKGIKATGIKWRVDMQSGFTSGLIALRAEMPSTMRTEERAVVDAEFQALIRRLNAQPLSATEGK